MTVFIAILLLLACLCIRTVPADAHIVDGDSLVVRGQRWRLAGFDAPETHQPGGREATAHLRHVLATSRKLAIVTGRDVYGRRLAHVLTARGPLSWRMIASGHAHPLAAIGILPLIWARLRRNGVWGKGHAVMAPRQWRAQHPRA